MDDSNRWNLDAQAQALVSHYIDNKAVTNRKGLPEDYIYALHHDGPTLGYGGLSISQSKVMPLISQAEHLLTLPGFDGGPTPTGVLGGVLVPVDTPSGVKHVALTETIVTPAGPKIVNVGSHAASIFYEMQREFIDQVIGKVLAESPAQTHGGGTGYVGETRVVQTPSGPKVVNVMTTVDTPSGPKEVWVGSSTSTFGGGTSGGGGASGNWTSGGGGTKPTYVSGTGYVGDHPGPSGGGGGSGGGGLRKQGLRCVWFAYGKGMVKGGMFCV